jgi:CRP-like cAMP-binding protein
VPSKQLATTSSYVAATDVSLFRVDQRTIRLIIKSQQTKSDNDRLKLLQGVKFLNELCESDLKKLASVMAPFAFGKDQLIVERGAASENTFYIIQEGTVICKDVIAGDTQYENNVLGPGEWFSDGSLIPHESRHMNVIAQSRGRLFSIDRTTFDSVLGKFKDLVLKAQDSRRLSGMKCLKNAKLNGRQLASLASVIVEKKYMQMQLIVAQALKTKIAIYIVRKGEVEISRRGKTEIVKAGGYFGGELFNDDGTFDASVYCKPHFSAKALSSVICGILTLQDARTVFDTALLADQSVLSESFNMSFARIDTDADLDDLIKHTILGEGTFGQVWLVSEPLPEMQEDRPYALKIQSKCELAREGHIKAVMEEKRILAQIQHPFTCKLVKAFQDSVFVYLLMELVQGGELFSLLHSDEHHDMGFPEEQAKFYAFCLSDVFAYIHRNKLVFRDLKPENVMIDHKGYPILIDFGYVSYYVLVMRLITHECS